MKEIIITSYYFPPENTPRAFRTFELARYFSLNGFKVSLFIPDNNHDYSDWISTYNFSIIKIKRGIFLNKIQESVVSPSNSNNYVGKSYSFFKKYFRYFIGTKDIEYAYTLYAALLENVKSYDNLISIALPFSVTLGSAMFMNKVPPKGRAIAEYGDPYFYNPYFSRFIAHKHLENWALKRHDLITITTDKILEYLTPYKSTKRISVIPQGFDFSEIEIATYHKNIKLQFAYAGIFYEKERDPSEFLEFLYSLEKIDFQFHIYTDLKGKISDGYKLAVPFVNKLKDKLILHDLIPRKELIWELSKMDFLINIETRQANPSKLIDYSLSKRPVLEIDKQGLFKKSFFEFASGNFSEDLLKNFDLSTYDIKNVGKRFNDLLQG